MNLDIRDIQKTLPHRYPFLLVDQILELEPGERVQGLKNVTANEPYFQGHFPGNPIMPGVLILEAMAQVGAIGVLSMPENKGKLGLFAGADKVRFRKPVRPGDQLIITVEIVRLRGVVGKGKAWAHVDGVLVSEAEILFALE